MAARALFEAGEQKLRQFLRDLALSAHWRNTWLFAASRVFTDHEHLRNDVIVLLDELDTANSRTRYVLPGAQLAVDMLDETSPRPSRSTPGC